VIPLFLPGPVTLSEQTRLAMAREPLFHRGPAFGAQLVNISDRLGTVLGTVRPSLGTAASGTLLLESVFHNLADDTFVVATNGYFGERLPEMAAMAGQQVTHLDFPWSEPLDLGRIEESLTSDPVALVVVHHETSTGFVNDLTELGKMCRSRRTLLVVDCVSSAGALPIHMDDDGLDVVITTSQKGLGGSPGVGFLTMSDKAVAAVEEATHRTAYGIDWLRMLRAFGRTPPEALWTPPVTVCAGVEQALIELTRDLATHQEFLRGLGTTMRIGVTALGCEPLPTGAVPVPPVTAVRPPAILPPDKLRAQLAELGIQVAAGQGRYAGEILRISHLGLELFHVLGFLSSLEVAMAALGKPTENRLSSVLTEALT